jgi:hypothetical protein
MLTMSNFQSWQIPAAFRGSFESTNGVREFGAQIVNVNPENTRFQVTLFVRGAIVPWTTTVNAPIVHGSGKSADVVAVERACAQWADCTVKLANVKIFDEDEYMENSLRDA